MFEKNKAATAACSFKLLSKLHLRVECRLRLELDVCSINELKVALKWIETRNANQEQNIENQVSASKKN